MNKLGYHIRGQNKTDQPYMLLALPMKSSKVKVFREGVCVVVPNHARAIPQPLRPLSVDGESLSNRKDLIWPFSLLFPM